MRPPRGHKFVITRFLTEQLEERLKESTEPAISLAARQEVCRKPCSASRAPSQSLLLTGTVPEGRHATGQRSRKDPCKHCGSNQVHRPFGLTTGLGRPSGQQC